MVIPGEKKSTVDNSLATLKTYKCFSIFWYNLLCIINNTHCIYQHKKCALPNWFDVRERCVHTKALQQRMPHHIIFFDCIWRAIVDYAITSPLKFRNRKQTSSLILLALFRCCYCSFNVLVLLSLQVCEYYAISFKARKKDKCKNIGQSLNK